MITPTLLYSAKFDQQSVVIDYSDYIADDDNTIQLLIYVEIGDCGTNSSPWIKISNPSNVHYTRVRGRSPASNWFSSSETFTFRVE